MAIPVTNNYTGRIWRLVTTGTTPLANAKIEGGIWTGATAADLFSIVDVAGRQYDWQYPADGSAVVITKLGWLSGPITITSLPRGEVHLYMGTR